jgi:hypothetical protein
MAKQPDWKKRDKQTDRQNVAVAPPKGAEDKVITPLSGGGKLEEVSLDKPIEVKKKHAKAFTREQLEGMKMGALRKIGRKYGVKDNVKSELIDKIMGAIG